MLPLETDTYTAILKETADFFEPQKRYALLPDYKDNYLIDLAHQTKAMLVTNDSHFTIARKLQRPAVKIITVQEFYKLVQL